jgi:hypothetical protein
MYNRHYKRYKRRRNPDSGSRLRRKNPDEELRRLERLAATGDTEALERLENYQRRINPSSGTRWPVNYYADYEPEETVVVKFRDVSAARAFLIKHHDKLKDIDVDEEIKRVNESLQDTDDEGLKMWLEVLKQAKMAKKMIRDADKRNLRRQVTSMAGRGKDKRKTKYTDEYGNVDPKKILEYGIIAAQLNTLYGGREGIPQFLKWCGVIGDLAEAHPEGPHHRLINELDKILKEKCENIKEQKNTGKVPHFKEEACEAYDDSCRQYSLFPDDTGPTPAETGSYRHNIDEDYDDYDDNPEDYDDYDDNPEDYDEYLENPMSAIPDHHEWEEAVGPKGELIRFKVERYTTTDKKGRIKSFTRVNPKRVKPNDGDLILDMTCGIKVSMQTPEGRVDLPETALTNEMISNYKNSFLYKVRLVAAKKETPRNFVKLCFDMLYRVDREALLEELNRVHGNGKRKKRSMKKRKK